LLRTGYAQSGDRGPAGRHPPAGQLRYRQPSPGSRLNPHSGRQPQPSTRNGAPVATVPGTLAKRWRALRPGAS
jgi:hypothetical protein